MQNPRSRVPLSCVVAILGLAGVTIGCGDTANPVRPSALSGASGVERLVAQAPGEGRTGGATGPQANTAFPLGGQLAEVRQATVRFHDISAAYAAGYTTEFEPCVEIPGGPVMGVHARNEALM